MSWTNERADTLFVCESDRKAAAPKRDPASEASYQAWPEQRHPNPALAQVGQGQLELVEAVVELSFTDH
jgi:hypothetical protein